jgi:AraC family transcriptional regulator
MIGREKMLTPELKTIPETKLIGMRMNMSLAANKTFELWRSFMPRRKEILNKVNATDMFSMQVYPQSYDFGNINLNAVFEKLAVVAVSDVDTIPEGMEPFVLPKGLYAVFHHKGDASTGPQVFGYIFGTWLHASDYVIDNRPHFEILGEKYKHDNPDSEEEIWIPVKKKIQ